MSRFWISAGQLCLVRALLEVVRGIASQLGQGSLVSVFGVSRTQACFFHVYFDMPPARIKEYK
jgi:hypothetical protein